MRLAFALVLAAFAVPPQQAATISITTADDVRTAKSMSIKDVAGKLCVEYEPLTGGREVLPCADLVEIALGTPSTPALSPALIELITTAGDSIIGTLGEEGRDAVNIQNAGLGQISVSFTHIDQVRFIANRATWPASVVAFKDRTQDSLVTSTSDERRGTLLSFSAKNGVAIQDARSKTRTVKTAEASIALFFPAPDVKPPVAPSTLHSVILLTDGSSIQGTISSFEGGQLTFKDLYDTTHKVAAAAVAGIYFKNGRVVYLSDISPKAVDENPNYVHGKEPLSSDLAFPFRNDRSVLGEPIKIRGQSFRKGIGVHARSSLTYDVADKGFAKFQATIGIDDAAGRHATDIGNVTFRVHADGKQVFDSGAVTIKDKPRAIVVDIAKVKTLVLEVTFGTDELAQGDLADWALARVIR